MTIYTGTSGADVLTGTVYYDEFYGLAGDDTFIVNSGGGSFNGGDGIDTINFSNVAVGPGQTLNVQLNGVTSQFFSVSGYTTYGDMAYIENVIGSQGNDTIHGNTWSNLLVGQGGDDALYGNGSADTFIGGLGQDTMYGSESADAFIFTAGDSPVAAPDTIGLFDNTDHIYFTDGPSGTTANYTEMTSPDQMALDALFAGSGVRYVAVQSGYDVKLYADLGSEGSAYDQLIILYNVNLSTIDYSSIWGV
jgi:Ca2+-binding RTX toxin-like protein